jgi:hypothetical protein
MIESVSNPAPNPLSGSGRFADKPGVDCFGQHFAVSEDLRLRLAGGFATRVNIESSNSFEVGTSTGVVQVSRGVLPLESVP